MLIRDRVKQLRRVRAGALRPHPQNWRLHPPAQQEALRGLLAEIGFADALLARELPDGSLQLIDGHLRAETAPEAIVPVLVLDLSEEEAARLLATLDPLASLAEIDHAKFDELAAAVDFRSPAVTAMLESLLAAADESGEAADACGGDDHREADIPATHQVVVDCADEADQRRLYERLAAEGYRCRVVTL